MDALMAVLGSPGIVALASAFVLMVVGSAYLLLDSWKNKPKRPISRNIQDNTQPTTSDTAPDDNAFSRLADHPLRVLMLYHT